MASAERTGTAKTKVHPLLCCLWEVDLRMRKSKAKLPNIDHFQKRLVGWGRDTMLASQQVCYLLAGRAEVAERSAWCVCTNRILVVLGDLHHADLLTPSPLLSGKQPIHQEANITALPHLGISIQVLS